jgi:hypothetical protein
MSRDELAAIVSIEYLKYLLGKNNYFDITTFSLETQSAKRPG